MTTKALIKALQAADPGGTRQVVLQIDPEGNGYTRARGVEGNSRVRWQPGVERVEESYEILTPALRDQGFTEEDLLTGGRPAVVIYP